MSFISIPGQRHDGTRDPDWVKEQVRKRYPEFFANRGESGKHSGFEPGEACLWRGEQAEVIHEEHDQHSGVTDTVVRVGNKTYETRWRRTGDRQMTITDTRRIFS